MSSTLVRDDTMIGTARAHAIDANWPDWHAAYLVAEHACTPLPT